MGKDLVPHGASETFDIEHRVYEREWEGLRLEWKLKPDYRHLKAKELTLLWFFRKLI